MSENSSNHYNSYLYLSDFEVPTYLKSWIRRCNSLTANDFETHSPLYRELDAQRLDFIEFFSRSIEEIVAGFEYMREYRRSLRIQAKIERINEEINEQEREAFERKKKVFETKFKGTKWEYLFWDLLFEGEWEGDEDAVNETKAELERLRKEFIKEFGHVPEYEFLIV